MRKAPAIENLPCPYLQSRDSFIQIFRKRPIWNSMSIVLMQLAEFGVTSACDQIIVQVVRFLGRCFLLRPTAATKLNIAKEKTLWT